MVLGESVHRTGSIGGEIRWAGGARPRVAKREAGAETKRVWLCRPPREH